MASLTSSAAAESNTAACCNPLAAEPCPWQIHLVQRLGVLGLIAYAVWAALRRGRAQA